MRNGCKAMVLIPARPDVSTVTMQPMSGFFEGEDHQGISIQQASITIIEAVCPVSHTEYCHQQLLESSGMRN